MFSALLAAVKGGHAHNKGKLFLFYFYQTKPYLNTIACSMWTYTDIYKAIIKYIDTDLQNTDYVLNFGVVAIATQSP